MSQLSFVSEFSRKLAQFPVDIEPTFEGTREKPMVMAGMPIPLPPAAIEPEQVTVTLKSIRAPKFAVQYDVYTNSSIYSLKERLVSDPNGPLVGTDHTVASIRLLAKAKAVSDTRAVAAFRDFTVMFSQAAAEDTFVPPVYFEQNKKIEAEAKEAPKTTPAAEPTAEPTAEDCKPHEYHAENKPLMLAELYEVLDKYGRPDLFAQIQALI